MTTSCQHMGKVLLNQQLSLTQVGSAGTSRFHIYCKFCTGATQRSQADQRGGTQANPTDGEANCRCLAYDRDRHLVPLQPGDITGVGLPAPAAAADGHHSTSPMPQCNADHTFRPARLPGGKAVATPLPCAQSIQAGASCQDFTSTPQTATYSGNCQLPSD